MLKGIIRKLDEGVDIDNGSKQSLENLVVSVLSFVEQTHLYHILTKSYAEHMAIGEFYAGIQADADALAESYIGMTGGFSTLQPIQAEFKVNYSKANFISELDGFRAIVTSGVEITNRSDLMSLNGVLVNIQGAIDTLSYKLGFN